MEESSGANSRFPDNPGNAAAWDYCPNERNQQLVAGAHDLDLPLDHAGRVLQLTLLPLGIWIKRIDQPAIDAAAGTSWLKSSRRLASSAEPIRLTPVTLPPAD